MQNLITIIFLVLISSGDLFSQVVLDSIVVNGEKPKSFEEKIREEARTDIANGKVILFSRGWPVGKMDKDELRKLTKEYGFEYERRGDVVSSIYVIYENEVMKYLDKRNGEGWLEKFQEQESKLVTPLTLPGEK